MDNIKKLNEEIKRLLREDNNYGLPENVYEAVTNFINDYIAKNGDNIELYADYNDYLDDSSITNIFTRQNNPLDAFYDLFSDLDTGWYEETQSEYNELLKQIPLDEDEKEGYRNEILQYLEDEISWSIPYEHYNTTVNFDIFLNNPEGANIEYSDQLITYEDTEEVDEDGDYIQKAIDISSELSLLLLLQGHTKQEFLDYINNNKTGNKFFDSLKNEIDNCTYEYGNQIVFLVQGKILDVAKVIKEKGSITIPSDVTCGLVNTGNGSGSVLEIELEKPITGDALFDIHYYHDYRYNVDEVYGLTNSAWETDIIIN